MRRHTLILGHVAVLAAAMCAELTIAAFGDEAKPNETPAAADDGGLLAGPKVDEEPGAPDNPAFAGEDRMRGAVDVPPQRWFQIVNAMDMNDEQKAELRKIQSEFQVQSRAYRQENADELRDLADRLRESRESGAFDPKLREEYQALQAKAPSAEPFQERVWALLDEAQKTDLRERLEKARVEIAARRAEQRDEALDAQRSARIGGDRAMGDDDEMQPMRRAGSPARDGARGGRGQRQPGADLDAMSKKRFEFLMSKRSRTAGGQRDVGERPRPQRPGNRNPRQPMGDDDPMND